ncbi:hypothetical protein [Selenomonas sp. AB3002]|jgi:hypothetical protein
MTYRGKKILRLMGWMKGNTAVTKIQYEDKTTEFIISVRLK